MRSWRRVGIGQSAFSRPRRRLLFLAVIGSLSLGHGSPHGGPSRDRSMALDEALAVAFPSADRIDRASLILSDEQAHASASLCRSPLPSRLVTIFTAMRRGAPVGRAMVDSENRDAFRQSLLVAIRLDGSLESVLLLSFQGPARLAPGTDQLARFAGVDLARLGSPRRSDNAAVRAAYVSLRRALALHQVLFPARAS